MNEPLALTLPNELVEQLAHRVAELLADRDRVEDDGGYLDVAGAAEFLACKRSRIYALTSAGRIPHHHDGSRLIFSREGLRA
jgi:excisionase family DNA binding protein